MEIGQYFTCKSNILVLILWLHVVVLVRTFLLVFSKDIHVTILVSGIIKVC